MSIGRRIALGCCRWSTAWLIRAAPAGLIILALLLPANAQFWGNSWGGRQQQPQQRYNPDAQRPYNSYGGQWGSGSDRQWGSGSDRQWGYGGYRQRERPSSHQREQHRERPREV